MAIFLSLDKLFGADKTTSEKKEVIVVITPHIIRDNRNIGIQTPKDTAMFDDLDMELFRDSYRVRAEDVFDLGFVYRSKQFSKYRNYVVHRTERDEAFAQHSTSKEFFRSTLSWRQWTGCANDLRYSRET